MAEMDKHPGLIKAADLVRAHLCQEMLDAPANSKEKEEAKARYMAFAYLNITARAGREQDEGLTALAKSIAEREANLEAEIQKAVNEALSKSGRTRAAIPFEHPMPEAAQAAVEARTMTAEERAARDPQKRTRAPVVAPEPEEPPKRQRAQVTSEAPAKRVRQRT